MSKIFVLGFNENQTVTLLKANNKEDYNETNLSKHYTWDHLKQDEYQLILPVTLGAECDVKDAYDAYIMMKTDYIQKVYDVIEDNKLGTPLEGKDDYIPDGIVDPVAVEPEPVSHNYIIAYSEKHGKSVHLIDTKEEYDKISLANRLVDISYSTILEHYKNEIVVDEDIQVFSVSAATTDNAMAVAEAILFSKRLYGIRIEAVKMRIGSNNIDTITINDVEQYYASPFGNTVYSNALSADVMRNIIQQMIKVNDVVESEDGIVYTYTTNKGLALDSIKYYLSSTMNVKEEMNDSVEEDKKLSILDRLKGISTTKKVIAAVGLVLVCGAVYHQCTKEVFDNTPDPDFDLDAELKALGIDPGDITVGIQE